MSILETSVLQASHWHHETQSVAGHSCSKGLRSVRNMTVLDHILILTAVSSTWNFGNTIKKGGKRSHYMPWRCFGWEDVQLLLFLNLYTRSRWMVSNTPQMRITPKERAPGTHCIEGWVSPRAGLDAETRRKILCLCRDQILAIQSVVRHYMDWATWLMP
jgi:hypothetical protein